MHLAAWHVWVELPVICRGLRDEDAGMRFHRCPPWRTRDGSTIVRAADARNSQGPASARTYHRAREPIRRPLRACIDVIPGGVDSPVRAFGAVGGTPRFVERGEGAFLTDVDGNRVRRLRPIVGGAAVRPRAGRDRARQRWRPPLAGTSFGAPTEARGRARRAARRRPCRRIEMVRLVSSGTEATMSAIRLARGATGRDMLVKFEGCYHGHSDALLAKGAGSGVATLGIPASPGVTEGVAQGHDHACRSTTWMPSGRSFGERGRRHRRRHRRAGRREHGRRPAGAGLPRRAPRALRRARRAAASSTR